MTYVKKSYTIVLRSMQLKSASLVSSSLFDIRYKISARLSSRSRCYISPTIDPECPGCRNECFLVQQGECMHVCMHCPVLLPIILRMDSCIKRCELLAACVSSILLTAPPSPHLLPFFPFSFSFAHPCSLLWRKERKGENLKRSWAVSIVKHPFTRINFVILKN